MLQMCNFPPYSVAKNFLKLSVLLYITVAIVNFFQQLYVNDILAAHYAASDVQHSKTHRRGDGV